MLNVIKHVPKFIRQLGIYFLVNGEHCSDLDKGKTIPQIMAI